MKNQSAELYLQGTPICRGIAIGNLIVLHRQEQHISEQSLPIEKVDAEIRRFRQAISKGKDEIHALKQRLQKDRIVEGVAILDSHLQIMDDPMITTDVEERIRALQKNAEFVFKSVVTECQKQFELLPDPYFRERFKDIEEIGRRISHHLIFTHKTPLHQLPPDSIVLATDLNVFDTAEIDKTLACAFITQHGSAASHAAIVAKGKGIPYVSGINLEQVQSPHGGAVIVDGRTGQIIVNPTEDTLKKYKEMKEGLHDHYRTLTNRGGLQSETFDGYRVQLSANIDLLREVEGLNQFRGHGIGLLRTESAFASGAPLPSEEEQYALYSKFVDKLGSLPIVFRTFDIGGDKQFRHAQQVAESNPFLGYRAIRLMLREREFFKAQLRAILRTSHQGNIRILFPMISSVAELLEAKEILEEVKAELRSQQIPLAPHIPVGCMVEVPSAAMTADLLAKECDFLSIGTNDLVQYTLAVDRTHTFLNHLYTPAHPAVVRLIRYVVSEANRAHVPVCICGEIAADPRYTPLLLGLGIQELSIAPRHLPTIKNAIRKTSIVGATRLAEAVLKLSSAAEIEQFLTNEYQRLAPEDGLYNH